MTLKPGQPWLLVLRVLRAEKVFCIGISFVVKTTQPSTAQCKHIAQKDTREH
jgi:hypothetical protein